MSQPDPPTFFGNVAVRHLSVVDSTGRERISMGVVPESGDSPYIHLLQSTGRPAALLETDRDGNPSFMLLDGRGYLRAALVVSEDGSIGFSLNDPVNQTPRVVVTLEPGDSDATEFAVGGRAEILINGADGSPRAWMSVDDDNDGGDLLLRSGDGHALSVDPRQGVTMNPEP